MTREDKHALFAAAALNALLADELAKVGTSTVLDRKAIAIDASWLADELVREVEKK